MRYKSKFLNILLFSFLLLSTVFTGAVNAQGPDDPEQPSAQEINYETAGGVFDPEEFYWKITYTLPSNDQLLSESMVDSVAMDKDSLGISVVDTGSELIVGGTNGVEELNDFLFANVQGATRFLTGPTLLSINLKSDGSPLTIELESNITTGYQWQSANVNGILSETIESNYSDRTTEAFGANGVQTITISNLINGDNHIELIYKRSFEGNDLSAVMEINLPDGTNSLSIVDPNPPAYEPPFGSVPGPQQDPFLSIDPDNSITALPSRLDWRESNIVTAVRDQGSCGGCWAFGTVGIMESALRKAGGVFTNLSEQFLISCNSSGWSCNGGLTAHKYHYDKLGINQNAIGAVMESAMPYTQTNGSCPSPLNHPYKLKNWSFVTSSEFDMPTVDQIKTAIYKYGPITAGVCVGPNFRAYNGGVLKTSDNCGGGTNHQIILVGWDDSTSSWILRNSWGPNWGESGYMRIGYGISRVGEGTSWVIAPGPSNTPVPLAPNSASVIKQPTYKWNKVPGATNYELQLYKGSTLVYTKLMGTNVCGTSVCSQKFWNVLTIGDYRWRIRAKVSGQWSLFSDYMDFRVLSEKKPVPLAPRGVIGDTTPLFKWKIVPGSTKYLVQVLRSDGALIYTKTVTSKYCNTSQCAIEFRDVLPIGSYKWRVKGFLANAWQLYSPLEPFSLGINSNFTNETVGWRVFSGTWLEPNGYWTSLGGVSGKESNVAYTASSYKTFTYTVRMNESASNPYSYNVVYFHGDPYNSTSPYNYWNNGYNFVYSEYYGDFAVLLTRNGGHQFLTDGWKKSSAIKDGWNVIKITSNGGYMTIRVNNTLLWVGQQSYYPNAKVGFGFSNSSDPTNTLAVDYAKLLPFAPSKPSSLDSLPVPVVTEPYENVTDSLNLRP